MQRAAFFLAAVVRDDLRFGPSAAPTAWLGWAFVLHAAILYPLLGLWVGHEYPKMPMFGITPCPVTIFSVELLLLTSAPVPRWIFVIPFVWSLIGGSAAFLPGIPQDGLLLSSGIAIPVIVFRDRSRPRGVGAR